MRPRIALMALVLSFCLACGVRRARRYLAACRIGPM